MIVYSFLLASSGKGEKMSYLKRICVWILSMSLIIASGCMKKELILETGESIVPETEVLLETELETSSQKEDSKALIYVYVCGYVKCPGVYGLNNGDRIYQAIEMAGGAALEADLSGLNLASVLSDGQKIYVPSYEEMKEELQELLNSGQDYETIVRIVKEQWGLYLPDEEIFYNDRNE